MPLKRRAGKAAGKLGARAGRRVAPHAGRAAWKLGKAEAKLIQKALSSREPRSSRYLKYALFTALGVGIGAWLKRASGGDDRTWGTPDYQRPGDANRSGAERSYSSPADGPLIGESGGGVTTATMPQQNEEAEQRVRTALGEDDRTRDEGRINVVVTNEVAELRGAVSSEATKQAAAQIAEAAEGVNEVRNLITVE